MDVVILAMSALCLLLLVVLLFKQNGAPRHLQSTLEERLSRQLEEEKQLNQELRRELTQTMNSSMQTLGSLLSENQRLAAQSSQDTLLRLESRLKTLESNNNQNLEAMRETIAKRLGDIQ